MGYPNSVEEVDRGLLAEGLDELLDSDSDSAEKTFYEMEREVRKGMKPIMNAQRRGYGYWLDNCGDGEWYCQHCLQPECGKRMAKRI